MSNHPARRPHHRRRARRPRPVRNKGNSTNARRRAKAIQRRLWVHQMTHIGGTVGDCRYCIEEFERSA